jgi:hypothetical protein
LNLSVRSIESKGIACDADNIQMTHSFVGDSVEFPCFMGANLQLWAIKNVLGTG